MKNIPEKLKLMTHLQSLGVEPGMWYHQARLPFTDRRWELSPTSIKGTEATAIDEEYAWFSLEQVLELLGYDGRRQLFLYDKLCATGLLNGNPEPVTGDDYYISALKLLVQVVEKYPETGKNV